MARDRAGDWFEPAGAAPSTHVFKPGVPAYRDQALNEDVCLQAARTLGLNAVISEVLDFDGQSALVVARYDRRHQAGSEDVLRVHQEDTCQALSVYPWQKFESSGGPGAPRIAALLRPTAHTPEQDVLRFVEAVAFTYLIGAPDAHAKNYSVLLAGSEVRPAPMAIGGEHRLGSVLGTHGDRFAKDTRIAPDIVRVTITRLAETLPDALSDAPAPFASSHAELRDRLLAAISAHAQRTLDDLARIAVPDDRREPPWSPGSAGRL